MIRPSTFVSRTRYARVADHVRQMVGRSILTPGGRVPSVRRMGRQLKVSVSTVQAAYALLERERLIEARPRSGYFVCQTSPRLPTPVVTRPPAGPRLVTIGERSLAVVRSANDVRLVPLGAAVPALELLPVKTLARLSGRVARQCARDGVAYDALPGCRRFREQVARRALDAGIVLDPAGIVATAGAIEGLHFALRAVAKAGDVIAVESPTFFGTLQLLESLGLRALEVPTDPQTGVVLDQLAPALKKRNVKACLFSPNFQNPTGACMPDVAKERLVTMLAAKGIPLIEDDIYGELPFDGARPRAAKSFDTKGLVLWCSSLSKTLSPGLRAGWVAGGRFHAEMERLKFTYTVTSAPGPLLVAAEYLESGQFDRHLRTMRATLRDNVRRVTDAVVDCFPAGTQVARPAGGMVLWIQMPSGVDTMALQRLALEQGISIAPGPIFSPSGRYADCMRLNCAIAWSDRVERALAQVGLLARQQLKQSSGS